MVVPVRDIGNKFFSSSVISSTTLNRTLLSDMDMDVDNHINFPSNVACYSTVKYGTNSRVRVRTE